jgi:glycosyltransferase involved in cell wall biosynthesis
MKRPLRVLHIATGNLYGGVETVLNTLAQNAELGENLEQHFAVCFEGRLSQELRGGGQVVHRLSEARLRNPLSIRRSRGSLGALLRTVPVDVVIAHSAWVLAVFGESLRSPHSRLIYWLHDRPDPTYWIYRLARRHRPDFVIANSDYVDSTVASLYDGVDSEVLYYPVAAPEIRPASERGVLRAELDTPEDAIVIVQLSRMEDWKGHKLHLEALGELRDLPTWVLWIGGGAQRPAERKYLEELQRLASEFQISDRVRFLGHRTDVARVFSAANVHCQPNKGPEPFGIVFVEALYAGVPCITSDMGGAREIVTEECGLRVEPQNVKALASALRTLIVDGQLRSRLGAAGPARAAELCDPRRQMMQLSHVLGSVANG